MSQVPDRRAVVIVLDGCGAGEAPDAAQFGDCDGPSTVRHVWEHVGGFHAPNLERVGFLAACGVGDAPEARYGRLRELSQGKDSVTGHWEMMGVVTETPFPTFPDGFPQELIEQFEERIGTKTLGNVAASGTVIIRDLGAQHVETGRPIVYTSADSVFQIASHEDVVPIEKLYAMCKEASNLCKEPYNIQRVIARPFIGSAREGFSRTGNRKDFPLPPPQNLIDEIGDVYGIGVVPELFGGRGFRDVPRTQSNKHHENALWKALESDARFIFANFEDFDMLYGHRNDPIGFAKCLERFDATLASIIDKLRDADLLVLTADHGNDPTDASTDHSREYVPVSLIGHNVEPKNLGDTDGMTAIGATVAQQINLHWSTGQSLL